MKRQQVIDQPLRVGPFDEEAGRPCMLDRVRGLVPSQHGQPENPDVGELGADARRRLDAVHVRHRDVHQDDIGPQRMRVGDRLEAVGRIADHRELRPLMEHLSQRAPHRRVIVDDQNPERAPGRAIIVDRRCRSGRCEARLVRAGGGVRRRVARRDQTDPSPLSGRAVDVQAAAEQRQPLADAEQPPAHLAGLRSIVEPRRVEPDPLIGHGDAQLIVGIERPTPA